MEILKLKITNTEIKNSIDEFNGKLDTMEERVNKLKDSSL